MKDFPICRLLACVREYKHQSERVHSELSQVNAWKEIVFMRVFKSSTLKMLRLDNVNLIFFPTILYQTIRCTVFLWAPDNILHIVLKILQNN